MARLLGPRGAPRTRQGVDGRRGGWEEALSLARSMGVREPVIVTLGLTVRYKGKTAIEDVSVAIPKGAITAIIGPSGTGKSTFLRSLNRLNELIPGTEVDGSVYFKGVDIYGGDVDPYWVRTRIGMVFQRPNPFPMSIYENVAFGLRINGVRDEKLIEKRVREALEMAALWDEVKDRLGDDAYSLSMGQQQRLVIARALAVEPEVLLLDEPTANLDPVSTSRIERVLVRLKERVTIVIVTHSLAQARRIADYVMVMMPDERGVGRLVEFGPASKVLENPEDERARAYISGVIG